MTDNLNDIIKDANKQLLLCAMSENVHQANVHRELAAKFINEMFAHPDAKGDMTEQQTWMTELITILAKFVTARWNPEKYDYIWNDGDDNN